MFKKNIIILIIFIITSASYAQESWMLKGYIKGMTSMQTAGNDGLMTIENTIYNRFDFNWYISDHFTFTAGLRNRIIAGNNVNLIPNYGEHVSRDNGFLDLTWIWADRTSWIGVSQFDRLMIDYTVGNLQITVGRQRINWGQTFVWNPNDLFNTYSYFDFDYEEKPGSDAVRIQYYIGESSKIEISTALNNENKVTTAGLFRFNTKGFDIQFLSGMYIEEYYIAGGGFSGSIAGGGFSGELTYFHPISTSVDAGSKVTSTIHYDYTFKSSLNIQFEALYNGFGADNFDSGLGEILFSDLSPTNLFPTKVALFGSGAYDVTPLFRVMLATMYGPEGNFWYVGPTLMYSMTNTIELAGFGQYFSMNSTDPNVADSGSAIFIRLKWSF
jgi:hypothetical protein